MTSIESKIGLLYSMFRQSSHSLDILFERSNLQLNDIPEAEWDLDRWIFHVSFAGQTRASKVSIEDALDQLLAHFAKQHKVDAAKLRVQAEEAEAISERLLGGPQ